MKITLLSDAAGRMLTTDWSIARCRSIKRMVTIFMLQELLHQERLLPKMAQALLTGLQQFCLVVGFQYQWGTSVGNRASAGLPAVGQMQDLVVLRHVGMGCLLLSGAV